MTNAVYPAGVKGLLDGTWNADDNELGVLAVVKAGGSGTTYTYSDGHDTLADVASGARIHDSRVDNSNTDPYFKWLQNVTTGTVGGTPDGGILDADDLKLEAVLDGSSRPVTAVVVFVSLDGDVSSPDDSQCIPVVYIDENDSEQQISVATNGSDIDLAWSSLANRIGKL